MNEKVLEMIYGNDYLKNEIKISLNMPIIKESNNEEKEESELKESHNYETGDEDN